jgi:hypothetical protein
MSLILGLAVRHEAIRDNPVRHLDPIEAGYLREYRARSVSLHYLRPVIALLNPRPRPEKARHATLQLASPAWLMPRSPCNHALPA